MKKQWKLEEAIDTEASDKLASELKISKLLTSLLILRNIVTYEESRNFFRPNLDNLHDPFLMKDMDKAVERLNIAVKNKENILIYGDYDVDGTTSVSLIYNYLIEFHKNIGYYIPDRNGEGYGISFKGIDYAIENKYSLIIALDCGIKAIDKVEYANEKNIDFIICDHHTPGEAIPNAVAVLDPKRTDCPYPYKYLSGCGVGFKLLHGYTINNNLDLNKLYTFLDLVVVSIGSDIVPITGENRILAFFGLKVLNTTPQTGLKTIIELSNLSNKKIVISEIVFKIGPRINAAGRMESGSTAVDLLITKENNKSLLIGNQINEINDERKTLDHNITDEAIEQVINYDKEQKLNTTVVYSENWHKGVIGIVASRLIESFFRPTVVLTKSNGLISGSARSVPGFNLYNAIDNCSEYLENYGGHMYAAGLTLKPENLENFRKCFEEYVSKNITDEQKIPTLNADLEIEVKHINKKFYKILKQFAPFGPENMKPVFISKHVFDNGQGKTVGKNKEHLKLKIIQHIGDNLTIDAIGFGFGKYYDQISDFQPFNICFTIEENQFMGNTKLQLLIRDIYPAKNKAKFNR